MTSTKIWYPHYVRDFKAKTGHLSLAERGAYRALMDEYWERQGPLPSDERALCRMIGAFPDEWEEIRENVLSFFEVRDGYLHHSRIDEEMKSAIQKREAKANRIANARAAKAEKNNSVNGSDNKTVNSPANKTDNKPVKPTPSPTPTQLSKDNPIVSLGNDFWLKYPHPPNRGSKSKVIEKINKLPPDEQKLALDSLGAHRSAIEQTRKRNHDFQPCMAQTFVNERRWEGFGEIVSRETIDLAYPDDLECKRAMERLCVKHGATKLKTYFQLADGSPALSRDGDKFIIQSDSPIKAELIDQRLGGDLNTVLGQGAWEIIIARKAAA